MILPDVNVLVYALRADSAHHVPCHDFLDAAVNAEEAYGLADLVLAGFLRIVTHPRVFKEPSDLSEALGFSDQLRRQPNRVTVVPGPRHWGIFLRLCGEASVKGNLVPDAYFAAMAIESGCEWVTTDRDYSRFAGLRWRDPRSQKSEVRSQWAGGAPHSRRRSPDAAPARRASRGSAPEAAH